MGRLPEPNMCGSWPQDCVEDYLHARSDDDRRSMLILFGYDQEHLSDTRNFQLKCRAMLWSRCSVLPTAARKLPPSSSHRFLPMWQFLPPKNLHVSKATE